MKEMEISFQELKISIEEEINSVDESIYPEVVKGLMEDMYVELQNLKAQYEQQRSREIEKIRQKYKFQK